MSKLKLIFSDFHLGKGKRLVNGAMNPLEDFFHDYHFKEFLEHYTQGTFEDYEIELILNGDILNLIQIDYHGHFTTVITESVSTYKIQLIIDGHPVLFNALKEFLKHSKRSLTYVIGNHDQEMLWNSTRSLFENAVGKEVNWRNSYYHIDGIHIEHGHQYEAVNRVDPTRLFLTDGLPEPILNLPWGTLFTIQFIVRLKLIRPAIDKVRPFRHFVWWSFFHDTWMSLTQGTKLFFYFISTRFSKVRYRQSSLKQTFKILFEASVFPDLSDAAKKILRSPEVHTVIFGHTHVYKQVAIGDEKQYLNTGSWTDIISMDLENFARRSRLTYVRVEYDDQGKATPMLRHWIGRTPIEDDAFGL